MVKTTGSIGGTYGEEVGIVRSIVRNNANDPTFRLRTASSIRQFLLRGKLLVLSLVRSLSLVECQSESVRRVEAELRFVLARPSVSSNDTIKQPLRELDWKDKRLAGDNVILHN